MIAAAFVFVLSLVPVFFIKPVYGQLGHLDSGQDSPPKIPLYYAVLPRENFPFYSDDETFVNNNWASYPEYEDDADLDTEEANYEFVPIPLRRFRRRIIPVGGGRKAIDRDRSRSTGTFGRSRSPWAQPPHRSREPVVRRSGPTGSSALYSLYPELAPEGWNAARNKKPKLNSKQKKSPPNSRETDRIEERSIKRQNMKAESDSEEQTMGTKKKTASKRKGKMSKRMKEDIAVYANEHGVEGALAHFQSKTEFPLKAGMVHKFLRRYKKRLERRANRS